MTISNTLSRYALAATLACGLTNTAWADQDTTRQSMDDALFTGPLVAPNPTPIPKGHWVIEPYLSSGIQYGNYNGNWGQSSSHNSYSLNSTTLFQYGLNDRISIGVLPQFGYNLASHGASSHGPKIGDTTLRAFYMLHEFQEGGWLPTISIGLDQSLPTGQHDGLANANDGLGSGVPITTPGLWLQHYAWMPNGRILRTRLALNYDIPLGRPTIKDTSVYGTEDGFNGKAKLGRTFTADLGFEYSMTRHWVPVFEIVYSHTESGHTRGTMTSYNKRGQMKQHSVSDKMRSSDSIELAPALEYHVNEHYGFIAGAEVTVAGRNTDATVTPQVALNIVY